MVHRTSSSSHMPIVTNKQSLCKAYVPMMREVVDSLRRLSSRFSRRRVDEWMRYLTTTISLADSDPQRWGEIDSRVDNWNQVNDMIENSKRIYFSLRQIYDEESLLRLMNEFVSREMGQRMRNLNPSPHSLVVTMPTSSKLEELVREQWGNCDYEIDSLQ